MISVTLLLYLDLGLALSECKQWQSWRVWFQTRERCSCWNMCWRRYL